MDPRHRPNDHTNVVHMSSGKFLWASFNGKRLTHSKVVIIVGLLRVFLLRHLEFTLSNDLWKDIDILIWRADLMRMPESVDLEEGSIMWSESECLRAGELRLTFLVKSWMTERFSWHRLPWELIRKYIQLGKKFQTVKKRPMMASVTLQRRKHQVDGWSGWMLWRRAITDAYK